MCLELMDLSGELKLHIDIADNALLKCDGIHDISSRDGWKRDNLCGLLFLTSPTYSVSLLPALHMPPLVFPPA